MDGSLLNQGTNGYYWSSTPTGGNAHVAYFSVGTGDTTNSFNRSIGLSLRCISDASNGTQGVQILNASS